ncbi:MAG TPA: mycofactocin-coupled SDR family oxidoreductase [Acidimicrobiales bacterium]|nr:mycofactocin-coupled SDR family oxidoreductase [Acidimicrobiales bacterium]
MTRVAIVTGAARGIGAATVDTLVNEGYRVVAVDRCRDIPEVPYSLATPADLDAVVSRHGESVLGLVGDVRSATDMGLAVETATRHFGRLDAVVACAGVMAGAAPLWEINDAAWDAVWSVNVLGTRRLIQAAAPTLITNGRGTHPRIVAVASAAGSLGLLHLAAYCAAKHAVVGLIRGVATDLAPYGVTANAVSPGSTRTPILEASARVYGLESGEDFASNQPLGRLIEPSEVAAAISWLCSPAASAMTGANVAVDAGMTVV